MFKMIEDVKFTSMADGRLVKKVNGRTAYFGKDESEAIAKYRRMIEAVDAGLAPGSPTVGRLLNDFEVAAANRVQLRKMKQRTLDGYKRVTDIIGKTFNPRSALESLTEADFQKLAVALHRPSPTTTSWHLTVALMLFKYGADRHLIDPIRFKDALALPTATEMRRSKRERGKRMFVSAQLREMVEAAPAHWKCWILLGLNCAFGCEDIENLRPEMIDLENGICDFPRAKKEIDRRSALWPETVAALRECPAPFKIEAGQITSRFPDFLKSINCYTSRITFSALRKTFSTVAQDFGDGSIVDLVMGHAPHRYNMRAAYSQGTSDRRLRELADYVRRWFTGELTIEGLP